MCKKTQGSAAKGCKRKGEAQYYFQIAEDAE